MLSAWRHDEQGELRWIAPPLTFAAVTDAAFDPPRQCCRSSAAVTIRFLETIAFVAGSARRPAERAALLRHVEMIACGARDGLPEAADRRVMEERYQAARELLGAQATDVTALT